MLARDPLLKIPVLIRCLSYIAGISETTTLLAGERFALVNEIRKEGRKELSKANLSVVTPPGSLWLTAA
jgi:hypothetical protein